MDKQIICQDSLDDESSVGNGDRDNDLPREDLRGGSHTAEDEIGPVDNEFFDGPPEAFDNRKREPVGHRAPFMNSVQDNMPEGDGTVPFPPEVSHHFHPGSRGQTSKYPGENVGTSHEDRYTIIFDGCNVRVLFISLICTELVYATGALAISVIVAVCVSKHYWVDIHLHSIFYFTCTILYFSLQDSLSMKYFFLVFKS